ncbi:MAG: hypothetical protein NZ960_00545 [Candidatus Kapabacteria bacterium]|nr:hypothetical protein [Candidatus Kapabacteria bacterium]MDW8011516.1 hypothetical protein [Bacteroidota bacterium]
MFWLPLEQLKRMGLPEFQCLCKLVRQGRAWWSVRADVVVAFLVGKRSRWMCKRGGFPSDGVTFAGTAS